MRNMVEQQGAPAMPRIVNREDAERLVAGVLATMIELEKVLENETSHVRVGRIREGLAEEACKTELATCYIRGLEAVKANAIALARFAPAELDRLKSAHGRFARIIETNQTVLATARAVSENLVKGIAEEMNRLSRPRGYAPAGLQSHQPRATVEPLLVSKSL
jgi:hypothetical protein